jgi:hypothetical protein
LLWAAVCRTHKARQGAGAGAWADAAGRCSWPRGTHGGGSWQRQGC